MLYQVNFSFQNEDSFDVAGLDKFSCMGIEPLKYMLFPDNCSNMQDFYKTKKQKSAIMLWFMVVSETG